METRDKKTKKTLTNELLRKIIKQTISEAYAEPGSDRWNRAFARARGISEPSPEPTNIPVGFTPEEESVILDAANILSNHLAFQPLASALKHSVTKMNLEEDEELA